MSDEVEELAEARADFIAQWGTLGPVWGITRSMAQIHAALLASEEPLSTDELMELLEISRGNANTHLRDLVVAERAPEISARTRPDELEEFLDPEGSPGGDDVEARNLRRDGADEAHARRRAGADVEEEDLRLTLGQSLDALGSELRDVALGPQHPLDERRACVE